MGRKRVEELPLQCEPEEDVVNRPSHYAGQYLDIECIDAQRSMLGDENFIAHCKATVLSYMWRLGRKDTTLQDARKAQFYMNKIVEIIEEG